jgi:hypothetical protein
MAQEKQIQDCRLQSRVDEKEEGEMSLLDLFLPPRKLSKLDPDLIHLMDAGTLTPAQIRQREEKSENNLRQYRRKRERRAEMRKELARRAK